ncbi:N-6 DNA methylase [Mycoplasma sp. 128]
MNKLKINGGGDLKLLFANIQTYTETIKKHGLKKVWDTFSDELLQGNIELTELVDIEFVADFYEYGLSIENKKNKKMNGQYYTPKDVSSLLANFFKELNWKDKNICDVGCGTGRLIITFLDSLKKEEACELIKNRQIFLFDSDKLALKICKAILGAKYGIQLVENLNIIHGDFLDKNTKLPQNALVISNPPYSKITSVSKKWQETKVLLTTKELYSTFMEKIFLQSLAGVIITPFSFVSGSKFYNLRHLMSATLNGKIFSFDNVPGNIFKGKKHGIFNQNMTNSVRAAITIYSKNASTRGFQISPLIRFKNSEREELLNVDTLQQLLSEKYQVVDENNPRFKKIDKELEDIFDVWLSKSSSTIKDTLTKGKTDFTLYTPTTCRYFTSASRTVLTRKGQTQLLINDEFDFYFVYCVLNSSFAYWWWRIFDGAITFPTSLLYELPLPLTLLSKDDKIFFKNMFLEMTSKEDQYTITKMNSGTLQHNLKFPKEYRNKINKKILEILNIKIDESIFNKLHNNYFKGD